MKINWSSFSIWRKSEKKERFKNMCFHERVTRGLQIFVFANFIYYTFGWWLLLLYTVLLVALTTPLKCYSPHWLCSWLFSEETLWVACETLFLEVLDNNNNNEIIIIINNNNNDNSNNNSNNNNNNSKYLFASSIFTMALRAID